jgi:hypothetical protein
VVVVVVALATLAVFAAEARAGSFGSEPPNAVLMKYKSVLQVAYSGGGLPYACNNGHLTPLPLPPIQHRGGPFLGLYTRGYAPASTSSQCLLRERTIR